MKKEFLISILIAGVVFFFACSPNDEFLKENLNGKIFPESFYGNEAELEMANHALYRNFSKVFHAYYTTFTAVITNGDDVASRGAPQSLYVHDAGNTHLLGGWQMAYETIGKANAIILNYERANETVSEEKLHYFAGQAHFARAYIYFWLVRIFDKVPYVTTVREIDRTMMPTPTEEIYQHIIDDLKLAEEWLPATWDGIDDVKRDGAAFTKGAAKAVLAEVYLNMAGYPLKQIDKYALAKDKAAELINGEATYGYGLLDHCAELWKPRPKIHKELVFGLIFDGVEDYSVCSPVWCRLTSFGGWGASVASLNFFHRFPQGERKTATYLTEFPLLTGADDAKPVATVDWPAGRPWLQWTELSFGKPLHQKMWQCIGSEEGDGDAFWTVPDGIWRSDRTNQMIRYAEVLLIYAEAQAMADGTPNDLAYECINRVRNRAFAGVGSTGKELQSGLNGQAFADSVFVERGWEFACLEFNCRWFDLVRREFVEDAAKENPDTPFLPGMNPKDAIISPVSPPSKEHYFFPVPTDDALLNPNLL